MPRKPTGRPSGRPPGSGQLADARRITVWLTGEVYDKLHTYAEGRHYHRGDPELAACVRELLAHALACPYKNQTKNIPMPSRDINRQIETITATPENNYYEQTQTVPLMTENSSTQIETVPTPAENISRQIEIVPDQSDTVPAYDTSRFVLGKLCRRGHAWGETGQSLLRKRQQDCPACYNEKRREQRQAKRQQEVSA